MRIRRVLGRSSPAQGLASSFLQRYLASGPDQRVQMANDAQVQFPREANKYLPMINQVANTCNSF